MEHVSQQPGTSAVAAAAGAARRTRSTVHHEEEEDDEMMGVDIMEGPTESQRMALNRDVPLTHFLTLNGITNADIVKLSNMGYPTARSVAEAPTHILLSRTGLSIGKISKMQDEANQLFPIEFVTATYMHTISKGMVRISTGSDTLNRVLRGGVDTGSITGIYGESGSGKSQLCLTLAVRCQMDVARGGAEGRCVYIDTTGGFKPERIAEIAAANGLNVRTVLDNILYICPRTTDQLFLVLAKTKA